MLEKFIFENHLGQRFDGLEHGVYLNYNDLRDYSWSYETLNSRISRFYRSVKTRKLPLIVNCNSDAKAVQVKNRLHDLAEADIYARIPGRVYVGDYYTNGFITGSSKSQYLITKKYCNIDLELTSEDPTWYREKTYPFLAEGDGASNNIGGADYPYDYPYDYGLSVKGEQINCDSLGDGAFRIIIYGEVTNPSIIIGGHVYAVNGSVGAGETLVIDGLNKTITLTKSSGEKINWFDHRGREQYIFEPIPNGVSSVSWSGSFGFDLTVIEKRSEPKWI